MQIVTSWMEEGIEQELQQCVGYLFASLLSKDSFGHLFVLQIADILAKF